MYSNNNLLILTCESPTHVGSGSNLGLIDGPIQREKHTNYPKIESSSLKGPIRENFEVSVRVKDSENIKYQILIHQTFGYDNSENNNEVKKAFENNESFMGALNIQDAKILLFPVKSVKGIFVWITCPDVIKTFIRSLKIAGAKGVDPKTGANETNINIEIKENIVTNTSDEILIKKADEKYVVLEEYSIKVEKNSECEKLATFLSENILNDPYRKEKIKNKLVVVSDDTFKHFVTMGTEVITRIKINNDTGTAQGGALFNEEYLSAETVLYSIVSSNNVFSDVKDNDNDNSNYKTWERGTKAKEVMRFFKTNIPKYFQIGGNKTLGKGLVSTNIYSSTKEEVEKHNNV